MATACQSLGEAGVVQGCPAPEARAVPANRCTGFRNQLSQVLGWKKGIKQLAAAGESRPGRGKDTMSELGLGNTSLEQHTQFGPVKEAGSEPSIQFALGKTVMVGNYKMEQTFKSVGLNMVSQLFKQPEVDSPSEMPSSVLGLGKRLTQVPHSTTCDGVSLGQVIQSTEGVGLGQVTRCTKNEGVDLGPVTYSMKSEDVSQIILGKGGVLKHLTQPKNVIQFSLSERSLKEIIQTTEGEGGSLEHVTKSMQRDTDVLDQVMKSVLSKCSESEQMSQCSLGKSDASDQGTQPVISLETEDQVQFVVSDYKSGRDIHLAQGNGTVSEQPKPLTKGMILTTGPRIQSAVGLKLELEEEVQMVGISFPLVQPNLRAIHRASKSKEQVKPILHQDVRSAWDKKSEQYLHLPLFGSRTSKQQMQPFKCQDVEFPNSTEKTGLEQQIFMTLTQNLSYIPGLYDSLHLDNGLGSHHDTCSLQDGSHLDPHSDKRDWPSLQTVRKRAKSCPGSPTERRKSNRSNHSNRVRFADSLGLELTEVRSFDSSEEPSVPAHVLASFATKDPTEHVRLVQSFKMEFTNPMDDENFNERLNSQKVCLEAVTESDLVIHGTILVLNLAYHKEVSVHYTCTEWKLFTDVSAQFEKSVEDKVDRFTFTLSPLIHMLQPGCSLQFAIKYIVEGVEFWDNNNSSNYRMTYQSLQVTLPSENEEKTVNLD